MIQLAAILVMLMTPWFVTAQGVDWYVSDGAAIRYEATTEQSGLDSEWALSIYKSSDTERTVHYKAGQVVTTWVRTLDDSGRVFSETVEKDGRIIEERLFDEERHLIQERFFLPEGSVEETKYFREDGRLVTSIQFKDGKETGTRIYLYYPDGRLAGVREQTTNWLMSTGTERPKSGSTTSWTSSPEGLLLSIHDNAGRLVESRVYQGAVLVSIEKRLWRDGILASLSTNLIKDGTRTVLTYDEAGRLLTRIEHQGQELTGFYEFAYDQHGRLILESQETPGKMETLEYVYDSDGKLLSEARTLNGQLVLSRTYTDPDEMIEEYYDKSKLFARIVYKGGRKVSETILSDGKVVRERSF